MAAAPILLDVAHEARFSSPCMVDHQLGVNAKRLVEKILRGVGYIAHREDPVSAQPICLSSGDTPKVCDRRMIPKLLFEQFLGQVADVILRVFRGQVKSDFRKIQICADSGCCRNVQIICNLVHKKLRKALGIGLVHPKVCSNVNKCFVDGINVDVLRCDVIKVKPVDVSTVIYIELHPGECDLIFYVSRDIR